MLIEQGLLWCDSPREVAEAGDIVVSMVTDGDALEAVTAGPDGIIAGLVAGKVYVDMSTVGLQAGRELGERVAARGSSMVAAPVSGGPAAAEEGSLAIMAGGDRKAFERVEPILRELGGTVTFVGDNGQALLLKLAVNISLAVQMLGFSESVLLAEQGGIERDLALDVLTRSATGSAMLLTRGPPRSSCPTRPGSTCTSCSAPLEYSGTSTATSPSSSRCSPKRSLRPHRGTTKTPPTSR